jgi:hypothetical protein
VVLLARACERGVGIHHVELDLPADEAEARVGQQRAGQEARLAEHLEAVADAQHGAAGEGELADRLHHGREAGDRAGPQVVPVGEAARDDHGIDPVEVRVRVPEQFGVAELPAGEQRVDLVAAAGEADHPKPHAAFAPSTTSTS